MDKSQERQEHEKNAPTSISFSGLDVIREGLELKRTNCGAVLLWKLFSRMDFVCYR